MSLTPYDIALIAGGFAIVGVLSGSFITYRFALILANKGERRSAAIKLRTAFSQQLASIKLAERDTAVLVEIQHILNGSLREQAIAVEEFRRFVVAADATCYEKAWNNYYEFSSNAYSAKDEYRPLLQPAHNMIMQLLSFAEA